jgi:hypothetical protein
LQQEPTRKELVREGRKKEERKGVDNRQGQEHFFILKLSGIGLYQGLILQGIDPVCSESFRIVFTFEAKNLTELAQTRGAQKQRHRDRDAERQRSRRTGTCKGGHTD